MSATQNVQLSQVRSHEIVSCCEWCGSYLLNNHFLLLFPL